MCRQGILQKLPSGDGAYRRIGRSAQFAGLQHIRIRSESRHEMGPVISGDVGSLIVGLGLCRL